MKYYIKLGGILFLIAFFASGVLALVNSITKPIIDKNQAKSQELARSFVLPDAKSFEKNEGNGFEYFVGKDKEEIVGYTFIATGVGYSSNVQTMVGLDKNFVINNIQVIYQAETPGLGANAVKEDFQNQFKKKGEKTVNLTNDKGEIVSLTGATITSRAITTSVSERIGILKDLLNQ